MTDYYFDGDNGNDTTGAGTEPNPYKSIKASTVGGTFNPANARFFIKRGTTVLMAGEIHPNASFKFASYGPTTDPKGKVVYNYGGSYFLATGTGAASTDTIEFDQLQFEDAAASSTSAVYQNNLGSGKIVVTDCDMVNFFNGVMTQRGTGHQILRCNITGSRNCGVMIEHAAVAAPSNMLIADNYIDASVATNDGIVLHAGASDGYGNVIRDNTIISGQEQSIDVMAMFPGTHILRNVIYPNPAPNPSFSEIFCRGKNSVIKGNLVFTKTRGALQIDDTNITVACNAFIPTAGQAGGPSVYVFAPALGSKIFNNLFYMPASYAKSSILVATGVTTGLSKNNLFINYSADSGCRFLAAITFANLATWDIDNNYYVQMPGSYATPWAGARTFADWILTAGTPDSGTAIVATESPIVVPSYQTVGQRFNLQKLLTIAGDSPLVEVGQHINYQVDMNGRQFWNPPSIGPVEYMRPRAGRDPFFFSLTDAMFYAPLRGSLALTKGTGSATFTRATACWEFNDEGKLVSIPSGAVRMRGYRPVINRIASSVSFAAWTSATAGSGSVVGRTADYSAAPDGTTTAYRLQLSLGGGTAVSHLARIWRSTGVSINRSITSSIQLKTNDGSTVNVGIWLGGTVSIVSVGPSWSRKYHIGSSATDPTLYIGLMGGQTPACADSVDLLLAEVQTEDTTGQDDKTPAEFVSKGVLSSPWHGAGADGVKYFSTHKDGTDIADADYRGVGLNPNQIINTLLYCRDLSYGGSRDGSNTLPKWTCNTVGPELISNGTFDSDTAGWTSVNATLSSVSGKLRITPTSANGQARTTITTVPGTCYIITATLSNINGSASEHAIDVGSSAGAVNLGKVDCRTVVGAAQSFIFTATGTTTYIGLRSPEGTLYHEWDDVSVKKASMQVSLTGTGVDNVSNSCSVLTAADSDAIIWQTITAAASAGCSGFYVKRSVGTGSVYFTRDGGASWSDITSLINSSTFTQIKIENTSVTDPQVGFKIATSGDAIIVDAGINHLGTKIASCPILTTSASVTVNAETLTYPTSGNIYNSKGAILATFTADSYSSGMGNVVGSSTVGLATSSSYTCQAKDGTNTVNGAAIIPIGSMKIGMAWDSASGNMYALGETGIEATGVYDGNLGLATIGILPDVDGYIKDVAIFKRALTNAEVINVFNS